MYYVSMFCLFLNISRLSFKFENLVLIGLLSCKISLFPVYLSSNILSFRQYIFAPTNIVNHSIFWFEVLFTQNFAFLFSYQFILMFLFSILYLYNRKYLQLFSAHSASMTSMQLLPVVIIQYAKYEIHHLELD
jgi:hypothetical protein